MTSDVDQCHQGKENIGKMLETWVREVGSNNAPGSLSECIHPVYLLRNIVGTFRSLEAMNVAGEIPSFPSNQPRNLT